MRRFALALLACLLLTLSLPAQSPPRLVLLPVGAMPERAGPEQDGAILGHLLRQRLHDVGTLDLMDGGRTQAIQQDCSRDGEPDMAALQAAFARRLELGCLLQATARDGALHLHARHADGRTASWDWPGGWGAWDGMLPSLAAFLGEQVGLDAAQRATLAADPWGDGALARGCLLSERLPGTREASQEVLRLSLLQPLQTRHRDNLALAGRVLREATHLAQKSPRDPYLDKARVMAEVALPVLLGSADPADYAAAGAYLRAFPASAPPVLALARRRVAAAAGPTLLADDTDGLGVQPDPDAAARDHARGLGALLALGRAEHAAYPALRDRALAGDDPALLAALAPVAGEAPPDPAGAAAGASRAPVPAAQALQAADSAQVLAALRGDAAALADPALRPRLIALANEPFLPIAEGARAGLSPLLPAEELARQRLELQYEHPYIREQILRAWAARGADALADWLAATTNPDAPTRALALVLAQQRDPVAARERRLAMLADDDFWVRFTAACLLTDADHGDPAVAAAYAAASDPALRARLQRRLDAPADPVAVLPPARPIAGVPHVWLCSLGADGPQSPFTAYYQMNADVDATWRATHAAGKTIIARLHPVWLPGMIPLDTGYRDHYWRALRDEAPYANLDVIDGFVFGEETMDYDAMRLWDAGWRLFCRDAGIDPARVGGKQDSLSVAERRAFREWGQQRVVDGMNALHDFTKLYHGTLRPAIQVVTFMPSEVLHRPGAFSGEERLRFDASGNYDYKGDHRIAAYMVTRRARTLWPERPVIWLSLGYGGYEMNPVRHDTPLPQGPVLHPGARAYSDSVCAWLAGAQVGFFSVWITVDPDYTNGASLRGVQVNLEDIANPEHLDRAAAYAIRGLLEKRLSVAKPVTSIDAKPADLSADPGLGGLQLEAPEDPAAALKEEIAATRLRLVRGLQWYRLGVYDLASLFKALPSNQTRPEALVVDPRIELWRRPSQAVDDPGASLLSQFDVLANINQIGNPGVIDLARYRVIVVQDPPLLTDAAIAALTHWLRETPGLLLIHDDLTADNSREASTVTDLDGALQNDWPWEADITITKREKPEAVTGLGDGGKALSSRQITITGAQARAILGAQVVLWQHPDFAGSVVLDSLYGADLAAVAAYHQALVEALGERHAAALALLQPGRVAQVGAYQGMQAASLSAYYRGGRPDTVPWDGGTDVFSGLTDAPMQKTGDARLAVPVLTRHDGRVVVTGHAPIEATADGRISSSGLIRVVGAAPLRLTPDLPERDVAWLMDGAGDGVYRHVMKNGREVLYLRAAAGVQIAPAE